MDRHFTLPVYALVHMAEYSGRPVERLRIHSELVFSISSMGVNVKSGA